MSATEGVYCKGARTVGPVTLRSPLLAMNPCFPHDAAPAVELAPRKHPVDDPPPTTPNPIAPVDEPKKPEPPVDEPDEEEPADT